MSVDIRGVYIENHDEVHIITDKPGKNGEYVVLKYFVNNGVLFPCGEEHIDPNQACNLTCNGQTLEDGYTADKNRQA